MHSQPSYGIIPPVAHGGAPYSNSKVRRFLQMSASLSPHHSECSHPRTCFTIRLPGERRAIADVADVGEAGFWLTRIHVPQVFRRQGLGTQLLKQVCEEFDLRGTELHLRVETFGDMDNESLLRWYAKHGFVSIKEHRFIMVRQPRTP